MKTWGRYMETEGGIIGKSGMEDRIGVRMEMDEGGGDARVKGYPVTEEGVWSRYLAVRVLVDDLCSMDNLWRHCF